MTDKLSKIAELKARLAKRKELAESVKITQEEKKPKTDNVSKERVEKFLENTPKVVPLKKKMRGLKFDQEIIEKREEEKKSERIHYQLIQKGILKGNETIEKEGVSEPSGQIEWWDKIYFTSDQITDYPNLEMKEVESILNGVDGVVKVSVIDNKIEHPAKQEIIDSGAIQIKTILTPKEQKRLRKLQRKERFEEEREKIMMGVIAPPKVKLKLSNMAKLYPEEIVINPSGVEEMARKEMELRKQEHERQNHERMKTPAEKKKIKKEKNEKAIETQGIFMEGFKFKSIDEKMINKCRHKSKELFMKGVILYTDSKGLIIVEGTQKSLVKFEKMITKENQKIGENQYIKLWEGKRQSFSFNSLTSERYVEEKSVIEILQLKQLEFLWKII
ncbi:U4/U6 small nuclear ribonucleoprotein Prp3, putative [Entamoeba dispar SAW760]|uniref:U4/U6 small nuclear ribonucleoprotein Prp3, putative n=1 Tax=Entamoeba dispar (strain ATCC PRA-260 / SAW760) TaxID=370354 RepID=B0ECI5_ENTDS|nr:U4/U6 small nuclear ribonucleoprotein Prp3, putative [Entamoeba dispar SAW760]EDR27745.1 U4/U6 small nuclear ribonucleoprotein Prp3, putative [Entamoeba dispar SAW760]|eukprot:EDR27745.1 U4/U6 small nuclear ribonucleoprotein Prp3, putative [Entamoeba dispar SAW760]